MTDLSILFPDFNPLSGKNLLFHSLIIFDCAPISYSFTSYHVSHVYLCVSDANDGRHDEMCVSGCVVLDSVCVTCGGAECMSLCVCVSVE